MEEEAQNFYADYKADMPLKLNTDVLSNQKSPPRYVTPGRFFALESAFALEFFAL